jgi:hypothetical protein
MFSKHRHVLPQVKVLEHHRQFGAHFLQLAWVSHLQGAVDIFFVRISRCSR